MAFNSLFLSLGVCYFSYLYKQFYQFLFAKDWTKPDYSIRSYLELRGDDWIRLDGSEVRLSRYEVSITDRISL